MKLTKQQKKDKAQELAENIKSSSQIFFTGYQGLKFVELASLRTQLRLFKGSYQVVKNSMLGHALTQAGITGGEAKLLDGPNGVVLSKGDDAVSVAKALLKFSKEFPNLKLKAAFVEAQWMGSADCQRLAALGGKPELLGKLAGGLYAAVAQSAGVLAAPIRDFVLVLKALEEEEEKKSAGAAA